MTQPQASQTPPRTLVEIIPVVEIDDPDDAAPLAAALLAGGVTVLEITLRTPAALEAISRVASTTEMTVGAGTVLDSNQANAAAAAGAQFVVSPGLDDAVVERTQQLGLRPVPGVATASELQHARRLGLGLVKVFPAKQLGGADFIAALSAPFPDMQFMPSGGVGLDNAAAYAAVSSIASLGTSWVASRQLIRTRDHVAIVRRCQAMSNLLNGPSVA